MGLTIMPYRCNNEFTQIYSIIVLFSKTAGMKIEYYEVLTVLVKWHRHVKLLIN